MNNTQRKICEDAIELYGADLQCAVACEEMAELQKELCKAIRGAPDKGHIAEEIADVKIMLFQMEMIFDCSSSVNAMQATKLIRLNERNNKSRDARCEKYWSAPVED